MVDTWVACWASALQKNAADKILTLHEKMVGDREIGLVCSSNLTRSIETANIIKGELMVDEQFGTSFAHETRPGSAQSSGADLPMYKGRGGAFRS